MKALVDRRPVGRLAPADPALIMEEVLDPDGPQSFNRGQAAQPEVFRLGKEGGQQVNV